MHQRTELEVHYTLGDALNQKNLVTFRSHALKQYQQHYANSPFMLELWALIQALGDYRNYIWGRSFIVYTDHQALVNINSKKADKNRHVAYWVDVLQHFNFSIVHIPGTTNVLADAL